MLANLETLSAGLPPPIYSSNPRLVFLLMLSVILIRPSEKSLE